MVQQGLVSGHRIKARVSHLDHVGLTFWVDVWGRFSCINTSVNSVTKLCLIKRTRIFRALKDNFCLGAKRPTFIDLICDDRLLVRVPSSPTRYLFVLHLFVLNLGCLALSDRGGPGEETSKWKHSLRFFLNELATHFIAENELVCWKKTFRRGSTWLLGGTKINTTQTNSRGFIFSAD